MDKITQKELDLEVADRLDDYVSKLEKGYKKANSKMSVAEYCNLVSALRYAISTLRGGLNNGNE